jgi:signal transduction histidine kinase
VVATIVLVVIFNQRKRRNLLMSERDPDPAPTPVHGSARGETPSEGTSWILPDAAKLESLAEFAAGAGHEINNPLATIIGRAQLLLKDERDPQRRQMLQMIGAQAYRIRDMIGDTMLFGRPPKPNPESVNLAETVRQVVSRLQEPLSQAGCTVDVEIPADIKLRADPVQLSIVLSELLRNSRQALQPQGGTIQVFAKLGDAANGSVDFEVTDAGCGFTELERIHAFDPFFSGRQAGRGLGFGLPKCWQIVRQHGGTIAIESPPGGPTRVHCTWPAGSLP